MLLKAIKCSRGVNTYAPHCTYLTWRNFIEGWDKTGPCQNAGTQWVFCGGQFILSSCRTPVVCFLSAVCNILSLLALADLLKTSSWYLCQGVFLSRILGISDAKFPWQLCACFISQTWERKWGRFVMTNTIDISHNVRPLNAFWCGPCSQTALFWSLWWTA